MNNVLPSGTRCQIVVPDAPNYRVSKNAIDFEIHRLWAGKSINIRSRIGTQVRVYCLSCIKKDHEYDTKYRCYKVIGIPTFNDSIELPEFFLARLDEYEITEEDFDRLLSEE